MKKLLRPFLVLLVLSVLIGGSSQALIEMPAPSPEQQLQILEAAFMKAFQDPEEFKASGIFQLLGYDAAEISLIGKITPRPASLSVEILPAEGDGSFRTLKVLCNKVSYYNLTIERVTFDFPDSSISLDELANGRLRFKTGSRIDLKTEVSANDILKVFELYAQARSLSGMKMKLDKNSARLVGRIKKGFVTAQFDLKGNTQLLDPKRVYFRCEKLTLNGMPMPRNAVAQIFKQINPVFDASKTWLNLNVASIAIKPGFVETLASISPKKG